MNVGDVLWIPDARSGAHCWVLILERLDGKQFVGVMLVSLKPHSDKTVVLLPGEHPFVVRETSVDYGSATPMSAAKLAEWLASGRAQQRDAMPADVTARIKRGALESSRTPNHVKDLMQESCPSSTSDS